MEETTLSISASPHVRDRKTTSSLMLDVIIALLPASVFGVYNFGTKAFVLILTCIASCIFFEWGVEMLLHRNSTVKDFSAVVTGLLLALNLSPEVPVWMAILGSAFAIIIVKQLFGLGLTCMFVGHGLGAVNYVSDRIAVMYLGKIVEIGPAQEVFHHPVHPYTRALIDAVPIADPKKREQKPLLTGEIGSSTNPPSGCRFHPRCPYATESCRQEVPELCSVFPGSSHLAACPYAIAQLTGGAPAYDAKMQQVVVEQKWR